jgi:hypothetical protein
MKWIDRYALEGEGDGERDGNNKQQGMETD